jgi:Asp-tRNA(Asn)/Glu-tRNA(Gln) amidotransferase C subunit
MIYIISQIWAYLYIDDEQAEKLAARLSEIIGYVEN